MSNKKRIFKKRKQIENEKIFSFKNNLNSAAFRAGDMADALKYFALSVMVLSGKISGFYKNGGRTVGRSHNPILGYFDSKENGEEIFCPDGKKRKIHKINNPLLSLPLEKQNKINYLDGIQKQLEGALALERQKDGSTKTVFYGNREKKWEKTPFGETERRSRNF